MTSSPQHTLCTLVKMMTIMDDPLLCMTPGISIVSNTPSKRGTRTWIWRKRSILLIVHFNIRVWYSRCNWSSSCFWEHNVGAPSYFTFNRSTNWHHSFLLLIKQTMPCGYMSTLGFGIRSFIYTIICLKSVCGRSQTAGSNSCSIASGDVSNWLYPTEVLPLTSSRLSSA